MIYTGLNRVGEIADVKAHGGADVAEVYGSINYQNPIFYSRKTLTGTSPLTFKGLGQSLKDYHIFGEIVQDGTPSPDYPVDVQGVGERTENLWNGTVYNYAIWFVQYGDFAPGDIQPNPNRYVVGIEVEKDKTYTISRQVGSSTYFAYGFSDDMLDNITNVYPWGVINNGSGTKTFSVTNIANKKYLWFFFGAGMSSDIMIVEGSTAPSSYIPYGYKIPITIGNVATPIYISDPLYRVGEYVDEIASDGTLTRRNNIIDILADTSKISYVGWFRKDTPYEYRCFRFNRSSGVRNGASNCFFTHNTYYDDFQGPGQVTFLYADGYFAINFSVPAHIDTVEKCIQCLTDIYESTGKRPVFVCPISTPTTEQVTVPSLSTIVGDNTLIVDTTVKPSSVSITGHIKPTGYGQLLDVNDVDIQDGTGEPIYVQG